MLTKHIRALNYGFLTLVSAFFLVFASLALAEDTDIFTVNPNDVTQRPNVLIMLDNTANWNTAFANEKSALVTTVTGLDERFNVGLMGFVETGSPNDSEDGAYVRAAVRQMTTANKEALANLVGSLDINFDKGNNATYGLAMAEIYRYFGGLSSLSGFGKTKRDYPSNTLSTTGNTANNNPALANSNTLWALPGNAYSSSSSRTYVSPIADDCAKNFVIVISNGPAKDNASSTTAATNALSGYGGSTTPVVLDPNGEQGIVADEWSRFMANSDVNSAKTGTQQVITYTIDVNPGSQRSDLAHTALLQSMATQGKGKYFAVSASSGGTEIADALNKIFQEVLATNSVFASATLPVSVNTRGTFLNQVYMGVFRPDGNRSPRWTGNLKQYKTAPNSAGDLVLVDQSTPAKPVEDTTNGFLMKDVTSFWTTNSSFWDATYYPDTQGVGLSSDNPDGDLVEKGGAAQKLRSTYANDLSTRKLYTCTGTCGTGATSANYLLSNYLFNTSNTDITGLTPAQLGLSYSIAVSSVVRTGNTAVVTTSTPHGFPAGASITLAGAGQTEYNGAFIVLASPAPTSTTFAITVPEQPALAATGSISITKAGASSFTITSLSRLAANDATGTGYTDSATAVATNTLVSGDSVTISGAAQAEYNGTFAVVGTPTGTQFVFAVPVSPGAPTALGSAGGKGITSLSRAGRLVSVATQLNHGFATGATVAITGMTPAAYNGSFTITKTGNKTFTYTLSNLSPAASATGSMTGSKSVAAVSATQIIRTLGSTSATVTTNAAHGFVVGNTVVISGADQSAYNGTVTIVSVPSTTSFTYAVALSPVSPATGSMTAEITGTTTNAQLIKWVRGENVKLEDNPSDVATDIRGYLHGDVVHSRPAIINYNRASVTASNPDGDVVVFYGGNDGIFRAVKGGQAATDGYELWGFVAPEHFQSLGRQYTELPIIDNTAASTSKKPYFADGSVATYTVDANNDGAIDHTTTGDAAYIYVTMRRGGRFIYAFDVTNPNAPKLMWKISNASTGFSELGQTWAEPKVAKIKGYSNQVLIVSAGYDAPANDYDSKTSPVPLQGAATMGRGVYMVDALTGAPLWYAGANNTVVAAIPNSKYVAGMAYAIPADASPIDSDGDGYVDRVYLADTGGNLWRANIGAVSVDVATSVVTPDFASWSVAKLAALGRDDGADDCTTTRPRCRKFLFAPDALPFDANTDSVLVGSGDREQPFEVATQNRFFMVKDSHAMSALPASAIVAANLYNATANLVQVGDPSTTMAAAKTSMASSSGWYVNLGVDVVSASSNGSAGEKVVTKAITVGGTTVFGTNIPDAQISGAGGNTCSSGLGEARLYSLNFKDATSPMDINADGLLTARDRYTVRVGGGLPPSPIAITVKIGDKIYEGVGSGATILKVPGSVIGVRSLVFWNMMTEQR